MKKIFLALKIILFLGLCYYIKQSINAQWDIYAQKNIASVQVQVALSKFVEANPALAEEYTQALERESQLNFKYSELQIHFPFLALTFTFVTVSLFWQLVFEPINERRKKSAIVERRGGVSCVRVSR